MNFIRPGTDEPLRHCWCGRPAVRWWSDMDARCLGYCESHRISPELASGAGMEPVGEDEVACLEVLSS